MRAADTPFTVNWFENPNAIANSLGLKIDLPDVNNEDPVYWTHFDRDRWRRDLNDEVDMTAEELLYGDPDWVRLKRIEGGIEVWFDLEEGIRFRCRAAEVPRVAVIIRQLAAVNRFDLGRGNNTSVVACRAITWRGAPDEEYFGALLRPAGFRWDGKRWLLIPDKH